MNSVLGDIGMIEVNGTEILLDSSRRLFRHKILNCIKLATWKLDHRFVCEVQFREACFKCGDYI